MFLLVLLLLVVVVVAVFGFVGYGGQTLAASRPWEDDVPGMVRGLASLAAAGALVVYGLGLLGVGGALLGADDSGTDSSPVQACRTPGWWERQQAGVEIVGYHVSWVPVGFVCETSDGGSYGNGDVPGFVNPLVAGFGLVAFGGALSSVHLGSRRNP
ncbi:hypothetical protein ACWC10_36100 [Streptomyces sp. NPDC001595]|uniref:hypothetical protein n=1 Tax=Streptomyces sp. NPDC001532 TaxID=3154520 RepID=UPI0033348DF0